MNISLRHLAIVLAAIASFSMTPDVLLPPTVAAAPETCRCGNPRCGGCLKGKFQRRRTDAPSHRLTDAITVPGSERVVKDVVIRTTVGPVQEDCKSCNVAPATIPVQVQPACQTCHAAPCACKPQDCDHCRLKVKKVKETKKCFEIEQKEVCVPPVRFPWEKCCPPTRSKFRTVNTLKTKKYECDVCEYKWDVYDPEKEREACEKKAKEAEDKAKKAAESKAKQSEAYPDPAVKPELSYAKDSLKDVPRPPME